MTPRSPWTIGLGAMRRQVRSDAGSIIAIVLAVIVTATVLTSVPRRFEQLSDEGLQQTVSDAPSAVRNVSVNRFGRFSPAIGDDPFANIKAAGERFAEEEMPESLEELVIGQTYVVDFPQFVRSPLPDDPPTPLDTRIGLRHQGDILDHVRVVRGRLPERQSPIQIVIEEDAEPAILNVFELAVTQDTLDRLRIEIDEPLLMGPDLSDRSFQRVERLALEYNFVFRVSGVIEAIDQDSDYWFGDFSLLFPNLFVNPDFERILATGLMASEDFPRLSALTSPALLEHQWRYTIDADALASEKIAELELALRELQLTFPTSVVSDPGVDSVTTGLGRLLTGFRGRRDSAAALLSLTSIGILAVAAATLALLGGLLASRRRDATRLLRSRGASRGQLAASTLGEAAAMAIPATALGWLSSWLLVPQHNAAAVQLGVVIAVVTLLSVAAVALPAIRADVGPEDDGFRPSAPVSRRRTVLEAAFVLLTIGAVVALRRRGLVNDDGGLDLLAAAGPTLVPVAAAVIVLRLYRYPVRGLAWVAARRRGVVLFTGLRRILLQPPAARLAMVATLLGAAIAGFGATLSSSISTEQDLSTWQTVGADYRISSDGPDVPIAASLDVSGVADVEATARAMHVSVLVRQAGSGLGGAELLGLDLADYLEVTAGTPAEPTLPDVMLRSFDPELVGQTSAPIPVLVSTDMAEQEELEIGQTFSAVLGVSRASFVVVGVTDEFPGPVGDRPFFVAELSALEAVQPVTGLRPTGLYLRAPASADEGIRAAMRGRVAEPLLTVRAEVLDDLRNAPLAEGVRDGFTVAVVMALAMAVVASAASLVMTAGPRRRDLTYLHTLGLSGRQGRVMTLIEHVTPVALTAALGGVLGVAVAGIAEAGVDLASYTGAQGDTRLHVDGTAIVLSVVVLTLAAALTTAVARHTSRDTTTMLRMGED